MSILVYSASYCFILIHLIQFRVHHSGCSRHRPMLLSHQPGHSARVDFRQQHLAESAEAWVRTWRQNSTTRTWCDYRAIALRKSTNMYANDSNICKSSYASLFRVYAVYVSLCAHVLHRKENSGWQSNVGQVMKVVQCVKQSQVVQCNV